jgi:hypothetical protein
MDDTGTLAVQLVAVLEMEGLEIRKGQMSMKKR